MSENRALLLRLTGPGFAAKGATEGTVAAMGGRGPWIISGRHGPRRVTEHQGGAL